MELGDGTSRAFMLTRSKVSFCTMLRGFTHDAIGELSRDNRQRSVPGDSPQELAPHNTLPPNELQLHGFNA